MDELGQRGPEGRLRKTWDRCTKKASIPTQHETQVFGGSARPPAVPVALNPPPQNPVDPVVLPNLAVNLDSRLPNPYHFSKFHSTPKFIRIP